MAFAEKVKKGKKKGKDKEKRTLSQRKWHMARCGGMKVHAVFGGSQADFRGS